MTPHDLEMHLLSVQKSKTHSRCVPVEKLEALIKETTRKTSCLLVSVHELKALIAEAK